nr:hypothetical protein [Tanacetum cinerariifolium]
MTGNIAYLSYFKEFDGGYVTFRGGAHGGRISIKGKFDGKSDEGFFVGYFLSSKAFRVYNTRTRMVEENLHIGFLENKPMIEGNGPKWLFDIDSLTQSMNYVPVGACTILDEFTCTQGDLNACTSLGKEATRQDYIVIPIWKDTSYFDTPSKDVEDGTHNEDDDKDKSEDDSSPKEVNAAGQHIEPKSIAKALSDSSWVEAMQEELLNKKDERGIVIRNNPRLVAHGHRQEEGIDYEEVFAPVLRIEAIRLFLAYASFMGFLIYVDDIIFGSTNKDLCTVFEKLMKDKFQISSIGELTFFLSLQVTQKGDGIFISQDKYVNKILNKFNYSDAKYASTPIDLEKHLVKDGDANDVDVYIYRYMIRYLMYLIAFRQDIMFVVCACARFQVTPKTSHLLAVKRIFRYLKGKPTLRVWYPKDSPFELVAYIDSDYAGATQERKSTTGDLLIKGFDAGRVSDEAVHKELGDRMERAATTTSSLEAKQDSGSTDFRQIVDFLNSAHIKFALTKNPVIYVSLICLFWEIDSSSTSDNREIEITAIIDGRVKSVTEASIRRHLKLEDSKGISSLPNTKIFEQLALMRYVSNSDRLTFQKGNFSPQWRFLIHTILHYLSPKKTAWEQFNSNIAISIIFLATNRTFDFSKMIFEVMLKNLDNKSKFLMYPRFIQIFLNKHKRLLKPYKRTYVSPTLTQKQFSNMRRASKGYFGVDIPLVLTMLVQGPILKSDLTISPPPISSPLRVPILPHDSPLPGGNTPGSEEGIMTINELTVLCTSLSKKIESLESNLKQIKLTYGAAYTKLIMKVKKLENKMGVQTQGRNEHEVESDFDFTTAEDISTTNIPVTTASVEISTTSLEDKTVETSDDSDDITLAETLIEIKRNATKLQKVKVVAFRDVEETLSLNRSTTTLQPFPSIDLKDKEVEKAQKERQKQEEATFALLTEEFDEIQARTDVDHELAARLKYEE